MARQRARRPGARGGARGLRVQIDKWLTRVVLTNLYHANDTYAEGNNDVDSWLKTFAATLSVPRTVSPGEPIPVTGYAQVGLSGLSKVQVWMQSNATERPAGDPYFATAPWTD